MAAGADEVLVRQVQAAMAAAASRAGPPAGWPALFAHFVIALPGPAVLPLRQQLQEMGAQVVAREELELRRAPWEDALAKTTVVVRGENEPALLTNEQGEQFLTVSMRWLLESAQESTRLDPSAYVAPSIAQAPAAAHAVPVDRTLKKRAVASGEAAASAAGAELAPSAGAPALAGPALKKKEAVVPVRSNKRVVSTPPVLPAPSAPAAPAPDVPERPVWKNKKDEWSAKQDDLVRHLIFATDGDAVSKAAVDGVKSVLLVHKSEKSLKKRIKFIRKQDKWEMWEKSNAGRTA